MKMDECDDYEKNNTHFSERKKNDHAISLTIINNDNQ